MLHLSLYLLLLVICLGAIGLNVLSLPGNWVMLVLAFMWSYFHAWNRPVWWVLAAMLVILLVGEAIELLGSVVGARTFGASKWASAAAIAGTIVGAVLGTFIPTPIPGVGNLIGAVAGAFLAAWITELILQRPLGHATKAAIGAALGRGVGLVTKIGCGLAVWLALAIAGFPR
jgi:uncharacterized protein YqgC (DUF456 family)